MENIEATKIESGITVNTAKRVKISNWEELIKNAKELGVKVDSPKMDVQPEWNVEAKPEWELVNMNSNEITAYAAAKPIRIIGRGVEQAKDSWDSFRQQNIYSDINDNKPELTEENVEINDNFEEVYNDYDNNIYHELENFGYGDDFAKAVEQTIETPDISVTDKNEKIEEDIYTPDFTDIASENNDEKALTKYEDMIDNQKTIEDIVKEALKQPEKVETPVIEETKETTSTISSSSDEEKYYEKDNDSIGINNLEINDLLKEITQISEANDNLKNSIATIENRNEKMLNTYHGIEQETKKYESETLKNAKELLTRTKEEQERLRMREEEVINEGRNIKSNWISADEANLMAKKRNEQLLEMLNSTDFSQDEEVTYKKVS